jgi:hypothetical protein
MGCRDLEPMATWVKGEGQGCRPCRIASVGVSKYNKILREAGQEELVEQVRGALLDEEDTIGKLVVVMDNVKSAAPADVRAKLESVDCEIQNKEDCGACDTPIGPALESVSVGETVGGEVPQAPSI